jgi:hypothetical protein
LSWDLLVKTLLLGQELSTIKKKWIFNILS